MKIKISYKVEVLLMKLGLKTFNLILAKQNRIFVIIIPKLVKLKREVEYIVYILLLPRSE